MDISVSLFQIVMGLAVYLVIAAVLIAVSVIDFRTRAAVRRGDGAEAGSAAAYADAGAALDAVFVGTTEWTDEAAGRARIEVSFLDDLVALRAFRDAIAFLGDAMVR